MPDPVTAVADAVRGTDVRRHASRGLIIIARAGYAARGVVYLLIGGLAVLSALGRGGSTTDSRGALETLLGSPGGWVTLVIVGIGLAGHALWRFVQAAADPDGHGTDAKGLIVRIALAVSGVIHVGLSIWAIRRGLGYAVRSAGDDSQRESWTAWLLGQPFGPWLVGAVGVIIVVAGVAQAIKGWKASFTKRLDMSESLVHRLTPVCRFGLIARGVVLCIIGSFFLYAGWSYDPGQAGGLSQAFDVVRGLAFGQILLAVVAFGLVAFAVYSFVEARYRRLESPV